LWNKGPYRRIAAEVLTASDVTVTMALSPKDVAEDVLRKQGFLTVTCSGKIWIDMTKSSPFLMREFAARAGGRSMRQTQARSLPRSGAMYRYTCVVRPP
jgi:3-hydroxyisobutyrate dehydrogenase-like beta-hydroxyacid dehydrogenase